ncbi:MAG: acetate--CoA ligase family protein [Actinomycetota bacterium]|nr:acetate--CoA ligase family protein [Actinomycetota bacterium]
MGHLIDSDEIDSIIAIHIPTTPEGSDTVIEAMERAFSAEAAADKTLMTVLMGGSDSAPKMEDGRRVPAYPYPESAAQALATAASYSEWRNKPEGTHIRPENIDRTAGEAAIRAALKRTGGDGGWLDSDERNQLFEAYGVDSAQTRAAATEDEAVAAAEGLESVVLKVVSDSAQHKSDIGGVVLDVRGEDAVRAAFRQVTGVVDDAQGVVVQEFVPEGHEVIVGMTEDPTFGPLVVFGLGGIYVELLQDVAFRINPLSDVDAWEMIEEPKSSRLLSGYRGTAAGDVDAVHDLLLRISAMIDDLPEIAEMDLNPVKVLEPGKGIRAVDSRVKIRPVMGAFLPSRKDVPGRML